MPTPVALPAQTAPTGQCLALLAWLLLALAAPASGWAQSVAMTGHMGERALLVIDGGPPRALAAGQTHQGVKVLKVTPTQSTVERDGQRFDITLGAAPVNASADGQARAQLAKGSRVVLAADTGGHFTTPGNINDQTVQFLVDTGASMIALSQAQADRLGLRYADGEALPMSTANGVVTARKIRLDRVRIGDVEVQHIDAVVSPQPMPYVLLGNSFLARFQLQREASTMVLTKRY